MYIVKYGEAYLHDPRFGDAVLQNPVLELKTTAKDADILTFTMQKNHPLYKKMEAMQTDTEVKVYEDGEELFCGRIVNDTESFYKEGKITCRGDLSYFNDSVIRPYETGNGPVPKTLGGYFAFVVTQHNEQVELAKQFTVGVNDGDKLGNGSKLSIKDNTYPITADTLKSKIIGDYGGYLRIRREVGRRYIDYLADFDKASAQIIDFGKNLLDYARDDDFSCIRTAIIPIGAKDKASDKLIGISSLSDGALADGFEKLGDMIYSVEGVAKHGWIYEIAEFKNESDPVKLLDKGASALRLLVHGVTTLEVKAIDLHKIDSSIDSLRRHSYVRVRSKPHSLDEYMLCTSIKLNLCAPEKDTYTLGIPYDMITGQQAEKLKQLNDSINHVFDETIRIDQEQKDNAVEIGKIKDSIADLSGTYIHIRYSANEDGTGMTTLPQEDTKYTGIYSGSLEAAPTDPASYVWQRTTGKDGLPGKGEDGESSYLHIKYSNDAGETFTANDGEDIGAWMGTYVDAIEQDGMNPAAYKWVKVQGEDGESATSIQCGNEAATISCFSNGTVKSTTAIIVPFSGWIGTNRTSASVIASGLPSGMTIDEITPATSSADGQVALSVASGSDLGGVDNGEVSLEFSCNSITFPRKLSWSKALSGEGGADGDPGVGIESMTDEYYVSDTRSVPSGGAWSTTAPTEIPKGKYLWKRTTITYTNGESWTTEPICMSGDDGTDGTDATLADIGNTSLVVACTEDGATVSASTITVPFWGYVGERRKDCTAVVSGLPEGVAVKSNTAATDAANGTVAFSIEADETLGGSLIMQGIITINLTCNGQTFTRYLSWAKSMQGADTSSNYLHYDAVRGVVVCANAASPDSGMNTRIYNSGIEFRSGTTALARFGPNVVYLGLSSSSTVIDLLNGKGKLIYDSSQMTALQLKSEEGMAILAAKQNANGGGWKSYTRCDSGGVEIYATALAHSAAAGDDASINVKPGTVEIDSKYDAIVSSRQGDVRLITSFGDVLIQGGRAFGSTALYNNTTGTKGTVSLSQSVAGFEMIRIFYRDNDGVRGSVDVYSPNGSIVGLCASTKTISGAFWEKKKTVTISGSSITVRTYGCISVSGEFNSVSPTDNSVDNIFITTVVGFR